MTTDSKGLVFYPARHRYRLDGEWVPGVTTILNVLAKPAIAKWAASQVAEYVADHRDAIDHLYDAGRGPMVAALKETPWQRTREAQQRGTTFHDFAERLANGEEVDVPADQEPLVESALAFLEDYAITPTLVEQTVGSREHRYGGRVDLVANDAIWDWKSGKRIYPSTAMQLNAYAFAEFVGENGVEAPLPTIEAAYGVHIREDGYDVIPLKFGPDVFAEFLTIRETYSINKRCEGDWRTPGSGYAGMPLVHDPIGETA